MIGIKIEYLKTFFREEDGDLTTFIMPTNYKLKEGSMSSAALDIDLKKKQLKTKEWSTTERSYHITNAKTEGLFPSLQQARDSIDNRSIFKQDAKVASHKD